MSLLKKLIKKIIINPIEEFFLFFIRTFKSSRINNKIKMIFLKIMGAKVGLNINISHGVYIDKPKKIKLGNNVVLSRGVIITAGGNVIIGDNSMIGYDTKILSGNHIIPNFKDKSIRFSGHNFKEVKIENDVWIGCNCVILPGVTINKGAIVGAGAVVNKNLDEYGVYAGVPAKLIRYR